MTMNSPFLVTPQWLAQHINDENLVVIDVRMSPVGLTPKKDMLAEFERGHIPARSISISTRWRTKTPRCRTCCRRRRSLAWRWASWVSASATPVIYDEGNQFSAPRGWWTFRNFGARHVYVLDEGLNGWAALGRAGDRPGAA